MDTTKTILLIDDSVDLVKVLALHLGTKGYEVVTASTGKEGLEKLKKIEPDLIILDLNMPEMGGIEFYSKLAAPYSRPRYPVLVLTVRSEWGSTLKDLEVDGFVTKPFEMDDLLEEIERILSKQAETLVFLMDLKFSPHAIEIKKRLEKERCKVVIIENLDALREKIRGCKPDFLLLEYMQEGAAGTEVIKKAKEVLSLAPGSRPYSLRETTVIVYSYSGLDVKEKSLKAGADVYIGKPANVDVFISLIRKTGLR